MNLLPSTLRTAFSRLLQTITDSIHRAVPAPVFSPRSGSRWRNIGQPLLPYHYMRPIPVPVRNK